MEIFFFWFWSSYFDFNNYWNCPELGQFSLFFPFRDENIKQEYIVLYIYIKYYIHNDELL